MHMHANGAGGTAQRVHRTNEVIVGEPGGKTVVERVKEVMRSEGITQVELARKTNIPQSTFNQVLNGKYPADTERFEAKLAHWLRHRGEQVSLLAMMPGAPDYFRGPTAAKIEKTLAMVQSLGDIGAIAGSPGVGKSTVVRRYQANHPSVFVAEMTPVSKNDVPCLRAICEAMDVTPRQNGGSPAFELLRSKLVDTGGLLVIDEAHHLSLRALDAIRRLHDLTSVGVVLIGELGLDAKLRMMPQLASRLGFRLSIERPTTRDVRAQLDVWGVFDEDERDFCEQLGTKIGGLRLITKVLRLATAAAGKAGGDITLAHLKKAAAMLSGANDAEDAS